MTKLLLSLGLLLFSITLNAQTPGCTSPCQNDPSILNVLIAEELLCNGQGSVITFQYKDNLNPLTKLSLISIE